MQLCGVVWSLLKGGECIFAQCPLLSFYFLPFFLHSTFSFLPFFKLFYLLLFPFTLKKFIDGGDACIFAHCPFNPVTRVSDI